MRPFLPSLFFVPLLLAASAALGQAPQAVLELRSGELPLGPINRPDWQSGQHQPPERMAEIVPHPLGGHRVARLYSNGEASWVGLHARDTFDAQVVTVRLLLTEPAHPVGGAWTLALGRGAVRPVMGERLIKLAFQDGRFRGRALYPVGERVLMTLVFNNSNTTVGYAGFDVGPRQFDVWINDELVVRGGRGFEDAFDVGQFLSTIELRIDARNQQDVLFETIEVYHGALPGVALK